MTTKRPVFLLTWERVIHTPEFLEIEIAEVQSGRHGDEEDWYVFVYREGEQKGCVSGAPRSRILTAKDKDRVYKDWVYLDSLRSKAKALNREAKEFFLQITKIDLKDPDREVPGAED